MTDADELAKLAGSAPSPQMRRASFRRALVEAGLVVAVLVAAAVAIYRQRAAFADSFAQIGAAAFLGSFGAGVVGILLTFLVWRRVLRGFGVGFPLRVGARLFFVSQLGKYLPGSVWPVLMQMEAGSARGASRRTMLGANVVAVVLSCAAGLVISCILLPVSNTQALARYWWLLLALPILVLMLHPRAIPSGIDRISVLLRRPPLRQRLRTRDGVCAAGWSIASFVAQGIHLALLVLAIHGGGASTIVLCTGAMALAVSAGVLFVPAPAGAGVRDVVLVAVLDVSLSTGQALAVVVASRAILIAVDLLLAALAAVSSTQARANGVVG